MDQLFKQSLKKYDLVAWIPCTSDLRFSRFDSDIQDTHWKIAKSYYSKFSTKFKEDNSQSHRKICSTSFRNLKDWDAPKLEKWSGEYRFSLIAENYSEKDILDKQWLKGTLIISQHKSYKNIHKQSFTKEESSLKTEADMVANIAKLDSIYKNYESLLNFGASHKSLESCIATSNDLFETLKANFKLLTNTKIKEEKSNDNTHPNPKSINSNRNLCDKLKDCFKSLTKRKNEEKDPKHIIIVFDFLLHRNGLLFLKDKTSKQITDLMYEEPNEQVPEYLRNYRVYKLAYYYIKQCFHFHVNHIQTSDSMLSVFNLKKIKHLLTEDKKENYQEAFKTIYEQQLNCLKNCLRIAERDRKALRNINLIGVAHYAKGLLDGFSVNDLLFEKDQEKAKKDIDRFITSAQDFSAIYCTSRQQFLATSLAWGASSFIISNFFLTSVKENSEGKSFSFFWPSCLHDFSNNPVFFYVIEVTSLTVSLYLIYTYLIRRFEIKVFEPRSFSVKKWFVSQHLCDNKLLKIHNSLGTISNLKTENLIKKRMNLFTWFIRYFYRNRTIFASIDIKIACLVAGISLITLIFSIYSLNSVS